MHLRRVGQERLLCACPAPGRHVAAAAAATTWLRPVAMLSSPPGTRNWLKDFFLMQSWPGFIKATERLALYLSLLVSLVQIAYSYSVPSFADDMLASMI